MSIRVRSAVSFGEEAGWVALHPAARAGSAVSTEAQTVQSAVHAVVVSLERSFALFGSRDAAISHIWVLVDECAEEGWDGEGGQPISEMAGARATNFIRALPGKFPLPEFAPEPDGSISLDWIHSRGRLFTMSVGESNRLAYAWLDGADRGHAVAQFDGETVPPRILEGIRRMVNHGNAPVRSL